MRKQVVLKNSRILAALVVAALALTALLASSCGSTPLGNGTREKLDAAFQEHFEESGAPGMMFGVWTPEESWTGVAGKADIESGRDLEVGDRFRIASVTKTFTAEVVLQLVDDQKLRLDDNVDKYIPGIPDGSKITIQMLLGHTSGLYDIDDDALMEEVMNNPLKQWAPRELLDYALSHPPDFPPGEKMEYSNTNYIILGMIIEEVTGNRYEDEVGKRMIEPLGLKDTGFPTGPELEGNYSKGYIPGWLVGDSSQDFIDISTMDMSWDWAAGAMYSTLEDLRVWAKSFGKGELISPDMYQAQTKFTPWPEISEGLGIEAGYGLGMTSLGGIWGHGGNDPGYNTVMYYLPDRNTAFVGFNNVLPGPTVRKSAAAELQELLFETVNIVYPDTIEKTG